MALATIEYEKPHPTTRQIVVRLIIAVVLLIGITLWVRGQNLSAIGFGFPSSWGRTIFLGLVYGTVIQFFAVAFLEPWSEKITNTTHDHSIVENVKGNWLALVQWLVVVWLLVAFLEEGVYRGFLMTEISKLLGSGAGGSAINVLFTAIVFGLSHGYQNRCGIVSTCILGILLGIIFVLSGFNLWLAIFVHGFIDTVGIGLIAIDGDKTIQRVFWKGKFDQEKT